MVVQKPESERTSPTPVKFSAVADLDDASRVRTLAIIDKYRELGIHGDISLPQVSFRACH